MLEEPVDGSRRPGSDAFVGYAEKHVELAWPIHEFDQGPHLRHRFCFSGLIGAWTIAGEIETRRAGSPNGLQYRFRCFKPLETYEENCGAERRGNTFGHRCSTGCPCGVGCYGSTVQLVETARDEGRKRYVLMLVGSLGKVLAPCQCGPVDVAELRFPFVNEWWRTCSARSCWCWKGTATRSMFKTSPLVCTP